MPKFVLLTPTGGQILKWRHDLPSEGNKIPETCIEDKDVNSKVRVNDVQCNNSTEGSLRTGPASKKKRKSKKKSENA